MQRSTDTRIAANARRIGAAIAPDVHQRCATARRIYIIGAPGTGKSTFAHTIACGTPVWELDSIAIEDRTKRPWPDAVRQQAVQRIAAQDAWIVEGVWIGWTQDLLEQADVIIWLDTLPRWLTLWRIIVRFTRAGWQEAQRQRGLAKIARFRDYARHLGQLMTALRTASAFDSPPAPPADGGQQPYQPRGRVAMAAYLSAWEERLIWCRTNQHLHDLTTALQLRTHRSLT